MKRTIVVILAALLITLPLAACTNTKGGASSGQAESSGVAGSAPSEEVVPPSESEGESSQTEPEVGAVSVDGILEAIRAAYGDSYLANGEIPPEVLESEFGLTPDLYEEARGEAAMISAVPDRVVVVKAATGKVDEVVAALEAAKAAKIADSLQYSMNIAKTNAAQVMRNGDFAVFLLVGAPLEDANADEAAAAEHARLEVNKAVEAFESVFS